MSRNSRSLSALALLGAGVVAAAAGSDYVNPGFETGDFTGWEVEKGFTGFAFVSDVFVSGDAPPEGGFCAVLRGGFQDQDTRLWQTVAGRKGQVISGYAAFTTFDFAPFDDVARVVVLDGGGNDGVVVFEASVSTVGDQGSSGWLPFEYEIPADGDYTLQASVRNVLDSGGSSYVGLDGIMVTEPAPEVIQVSIDVRPGSDDCINIDGNGVVPVVLYGSAEFDVQNIDPASLRLGSAAVNGRTHVSDKNGDGYLDVKGHFRIGETGLQAGDTRVALTGVLEDGTAFEGVDTVCVD
jgi:hypothetical protein